MKKTLLAVTLAALTSGAATSALAADPKAPAPDVEISGNMALTTDYRFRGMSQTNLGPAIQGGFDLAHKSGAYIGIWGSNVSNWTSPNGSGMELDIYGGYSTELPTGVGLDLGLLRYSYPGNENTPKSADSTEAYVGVSYGPVTYKYSRMISENWFTYTAKKGSVYHDLTLELPLNDQVTLVAHYGVQKIKGNPAGTTVGTGLVDFSDYKIGVSYAMADDYSVGFDYVATGKLTAVEKLSFLGGANATEKLYKSGLVLSLSKTF
jgi:uncharacterized protein (TIGR02001 family)